MTWVPITPETLPPSGNLRFGALRLLLWNELTESFEGVMWYPDGRWGLKFGEFVRILPDCYTHYCIPTPPGTPPAVPAEVARVLSVNLDSLRDALSVYGEALRTGEDDGYKDIALHIDAIRAARAALGMDKAKEQQP
jgi:hypothetical protein